MIAPFSGHFASSGAEIGWGIQAFLKARGDTVGGRRIQVVVKDTTGPSPEIAKRNAQQLLVKDKVDFLAGFGLTSEALSVAPMATQAKTPMIIMNAATSMLTNKSPYVVRVSFTLPQVTAPLATWAFKNQVTSVYTLVSDSGPGVDAETQFVKTFTSHGGQIAGSLRVPLQNPDFVPVSRRIKEARPQAVFVFLPVGAQQGIAFMKSFDESGLRQSGVKLLATGDVTEDSQLEAMGALALNVVTTHHYSAAHESPENREFLNAFREANGSQLRPNFMAVGGYDGMAAIFEVTRQLAPKGKVDGDAAVEILKGMKTMSPRGPMYIDRETRDVVQTVYVRRVEMLNGKPYNVEFDSFVDVKDPGK